MDAKVRDKTVLAIIPAWNEAHRVVERVISRIPADAVDATLVVDDGSSDGTSQVARQAGATVISHEHNRGVGAAIRTGIAFALANDHQFVVILNAAGKFDPMDVGSLLAPLRQGTADLVQGSRYLDGAGHSAMPMYRRLATRFYSLSFSLLCGHTITDATCGIRAFNIDIARHPRMWLEQPWLDGYELEPYLLWKAIESGHRVREVPIFIRYPERDTTRMRPGWDWWRIYWPLLRLRFGGESGAACRKSG